MIIQEFRTYPVFRIQSGGDIKGGLCYHSKCLVVRKDDINVTFYYLPINSYSKEVTQPLDLFVQSVEICINQPKKRSNQTQFEKVNWPELSPVRDIKAEYNYRRDLEHIKFGIHRDRAWVTDYITVKMIVKAPLDKKTIAVAAFMTIDAKKSYPVACSTFRLLGERDGHVFIKFSDTAHKTDRILSETNIFEIVDSYWDFPQNSLLISESVISEIVHDNANQAYVKSLLNFLKTEDSNDAA